MELAQLRPNFVIFAQGLGIEIPCHSRGVFFQGIDGVAKSWNVEFADTTPSGSSKATKIVVPFDSVVRWITGLF